MKIFMYHHKHILAGLLCILFMSPLAGEARPRWADSPAVRGRNTRAEPCNWLEAYVHIEGTILRLAYRCTLPIDFGRGAAYTIFLDTDTRRETGFRGNDDFPIGADYMLQGSRLYRYVGDEGPQAGREWSWTLLDAVEYTVDGEWAEFTICLSEEMRISGYELRFFLYGDNLAEGVNGNFNHILPLNALRPSGGGSFVGLRVPEDVLVQP